VEEEDEDFLDSESELEDPFGHVEEQDSTPIAIFDDFMDEPEPEQEQVVQTGGNVVDPYSSAYKRGVLQQTTSPFEAIETDFSVADIVEGLEKDVELGEKLFHIVSVKASSPASQRVECLAQDLDAVGDEHTCMAILPQTDTSAEWELYTSAQIQTSVDAQRHRFFELVQLGFVSPEYKVVCSVRSADDFTLQTVLDSNLALGKTMNHTLALYYAVAMLDILIVLHNEAQMLHCQLTPGSFGLVAATDTLRLRGFDQAVHLSKFDSKVSFRTEPDSKTNLVSVRHQHLMSWRHEVDYQGFCNVLHLLLFNEPYDGNKPVEFPSSVWADLFNVMLGQDAVNLQEVRDTLQNNIHSDHQAQKLLKILLCEQNIALLS
jgi:hypothetical protein